MENKKESIQLYRNLLGEAWERLFNAAKLAEDPVEAREAEEEALRRWKAA